jgi:hypothetical protein
MHCIHRFKARERLVGQRYQSDGRCQEIPQDFSCRQADSACVLAFLVGQALNTLFLCHAVVQIGRARAMSVMVEPVGNPLFQTRFVRPRMGQGMCPVVVVGKFRDLHQPRCCNLVSHNSCVLLS